MSPSQRRAPMQIISTSRPMAVCVLRNKCAEHRIELPNTFCPCLCSRPAWLPWRHVTHGRRAQNDCGSATLVPVANTAESFLSCPPSKWESQVLHYRIMQIRSAAGGPVTGIWPAHMPQALQAPPSGGGHAMLPRLHSAVVYIHVRQLLATRCAAPVACSPALALRFASTTTLPPPAPRNK